MNFALFVFDTREVCKENFQTRRHAHTSKERTTGHLQELSKFKFIQTLFRIQTPTFQYMCHLFLNEALFMQINDKQQIEN